MYDRDKPDISERMLDFTPNFFKSDKIRFRDRFRGQLRDIRSLSDSVNNLQINNASPEISSGLHPYPHRISSDSFFKKCCILSVISMSGCFSLPTFLNLFSYLISAIITHTVRCHSILIRSLLP